MSVTTSYQQILDSVEFSVLTQAEQEAFLLDLNSVIFRGAVTRTLERMDEPTREAWHNLIASGASAASMQRFLDRKVPQADLALAETVEILASDILAVTH
ncbi:MAG: hypothetical protein JWO84_740 [Parcubacteria group bacterium]|nr:hypothetical protein [Parcubacteria group bacterium]